MTIIERPVSVDEFDAVYHALPDEFTAELINGRILVAPAPDGDHDEDVVSVADQIRAGPPDLRLYPGRALEPGRRPLHPPGLGGVRREAGAPRAVRV